MASTTITTTTTKDPIEVLHQDPPEYVPYRAPPPDRPTTSDYTAPPRDPPQPHGSRDYMAPPPDVLGYVDSSETNTSSPRLAFNNFGPPYPASTATAGSIEKTSLHSEASLVEPNGLSACAAACRAHKKVIKAVLLAVLAVGYAVYFGFALDYDFEGALDLLVITCIIVTLIIISVLKNTVGKQLYNTLWKPVHDWANRIKLVNWLVGPVLLAVILSYTVAELISTVEQIQALTGILVFLAIPFLFSRRPAKISLHPVAGGLACTFLLAVLLIRHTIFYDAANFLFESFWLFREHAFYGSGEVFGDPFFLFHPYPMIYFPLVVFLCVLTAVLYQTDVLNYFIMSIGWALRMLLGGTCVELTSMVTGIFLGVTDTMLMYRPYLTSLTQSEFFAFLVGAHTGKASFATFLLIWSSVNPRHLLTAAFLSAPMALVMAKLHYPETEEKPLLKDEREILRIKKIDPSAVQAASNAAWFAGKIASAFIACTIFTFSSQAFVSSVIEWCGERVGDEWSLQILTGRVMQPFAWLMGVPWEETFLVGQVLGTKVVYDEAQGMFLLGEMRREAILSERSCVIATFASHGTAGLGYMMAFAGVWSQMEKSGTMVKKMISLIPSVMLCAHCAAFFMGSLAGVFYTDSLAEDHHIDHSNWLLRFIYKDFPDYTVTLKLL